MIAKETTSFTKAAIGVPLEITLPRVLVEVDPGTEPELAAGRLPVVAEVRS